MPSVQFSIIHNRLSLGEYRRHLPTAMLISELRNAFGGKSSGEGKTIPQHQLFEPSECLPGYAVPEALHRGLPFTPDQCGALMDAIAARELPGWAVQVLHSIMPVAQIMRLGGTRRSEVDEGAAPRDGFEQLLSAATRGGTAD